MNPAPEDFAVWTSTLIENRRTTLPKRLCGPGPNAQQKQLILQAAAAAPDHDQILPWRLIEFPASVRPLLGQAFAQALRQRDPDATAQECAQAQEKATRSPWLLLLVVRTEGEPVEIAATERLLSAGAAVQNILLMSTALGLGSSLTSGKALTSLALRDLLQLGEDEQAVCFVNIGHIAQPRTPRQRPQVRDYFSQFSAPQNRN